MTQRPGIARCRGAIVRRVGAAVRTARVTIPGPFHAVLPVSRNRYGWRQQRRGFFGRVWRVGAEAWTQINTISLWRLDEVAEQAGSRTWALLVAPFDPGPDQDGAQQRLPHAVQSAGLGSLSLPVFWRLSADRVSLSRVLVVFEIEAPRAVRLARRYGQVAVVHVQRIPYENLVVLNVTNEQRVELRRYEPVAIADALASMFGAAAVAISYRATNVGESQLMAVAERRLRSGEPR